MPRIEEIVDELHWVSDRISAQIRTISVSLLIITWGLIISKPEIGSVSDKLKPHLLIVGVLALVAMFADFLQYLFGYVYTNNLRKAMEEGQETEADYDYGATTYRLRTFFFWSKQVIVLVACAWFLAVIIPFCVKLVGSSA